MKRIIILAAACIMITAAAFTSYAECRWDDDNYGIRAEWDDTDSRVTLQLYKGSSYKVGRKVSLGKGTTTHDFTDLIRSEGPGSYMYSLTTESGLTEYSDFYQAGENIIADVTETFWIKYNGFWYLTDFKGTRLTGWQFKDDKWYYLHDKTGACLLNTFTPDGYYVDAEGAWDGKPSIGTGDLV
ncbi:MAG: hypothetical protein Q4E54_02010 [Lachnospiraceae bacterium]|nr:hypothetical protein [Lachnospiraceae bacterium]